MPKPRIIAFSGKQFSGKSTAVKFLRKDLEKRGYTTTLLKLAQPLYDIQNYAYSRLGLVLKGDKDRVFLQMVGTDIFRKRDPQIFTKAWQLDYAKAHLIDGVDYVFVDDLRFDNEAEMLKHEGAKIIRIDTPDEVRGTRGIIEGGYHASEMGIDDKYIDATCYNNKDVDAFEQNLRYLLEILLHR